MRSSEMDQHIFSGSVSIAMEEEPTAEDDSVMISEKYFWVPSSMPCGWYLTYIGHLVGCSHQIFHAETHAGLSPRA